MSPPADRELRDDRCPPRVIGGRAVHEHHRRPVPGDMAADHRAIRRFDPLELLAHVATFSSSRLAFNHWRFAGGAGVAAGAPKTPESDESRRQSACGAPASVLLCARGERSGRRRCGPGIARRAPVIPEWPGTRLRRSKPGGSARTKWPPRRPAAVRSAHCPFIVLTPRESTAPGRCSAPPAPLRLVRGRSAGLRRGAGSSSSRVLLAWDCGSEAGCGALHTPDVRWPATAEVRRDGSLAEAVVVGTPSGCPPSVGPSRRALHGPPALTAAATRGPLAQRSAREVRV
jgi:hypothetical protein